MPYKKVCIVCKKEFGAFRKKKFLCKNQKCIRKHHSNMLIGHRPFNNIGGSKNPNWKGGILIDKDGYRLVYSSEHQKHIREHRLVMQNHIGRNLEKHEVVHHVNGDKQDNRIENLLIMKKSEHDFESSKSRVRNNGRFV